MPSRHIPVERPSLRAEVEIQWWRNVGNEKPGVAHSRVFVYGTTGAGHGLHEVTPEGEALLRVDLGETGLRAASPVEVGAGFGIAWGPNDDRRPMQMAVYDAEWKELARHSPKRSISTHSVWLARGVAGALAVAWEGRWFEYSYHETSVLDASGVRFEIDTARFMESDGERLLLPRTHRDGHNLRAVDARTGAEIWANGPSPMWPIRYRIGVTAGAFVFEDADHEFGNGKEHRIRAIDAKTGADRWIHPLPGSIGAFDAGPSALAFSMWRPEEPHLARTVILDGATGAVIREKPRPEAKGGNPRIAVVEPGFLLWKLSDSLVCETLGGEVVWDLPVPDPDHHGWFGAVCVDGRLAMRIGNRVYCYG